MSAREPDARLTRPAISAEKADWFREHVDVPGRAADVRQLRSVLDEGSVPTDHRVGHHNGPAFLRARAHKETRLQISGERCGEMFAPKGLKMQTRGSERIASGGIVAAPVSSRSHARLVLASLFKLDTEWARQEMEPSLQAGKPSVLEPSALNEPKSRIVGWVSGAWPPVQPSGGVSVGIHLIVVTPAATRSSAASITVFG